MVRTAASISAAVRSGSLVFTISSNWPRFTLPHLFLIRFTTTLGYTGSLSEQYRCRRCFGDESKTLISKHRDDHGDRYARFHVLRLSVESFAELHDVHAVLPERGSNRRAGIRLPGGHLELYICVNLLCHGFSPTRVLAPRRSPGVPPAVLKSTPQPLSTCPNCRSTGVERPKIDTATRTRLFS